MLLQNCIFLTFKYSLTLRTINIWVLDKWGRREKCLRTHCFTFHDFKGTVDTLCQVVQHSNTNDPILWHNFLVRYLTELGPKLLLTSTGGNDWWFTFILPFDLQTMVNILAKSAYSCPSPQDLCILFMPCFHDIFGGFNELYWFTNVLDVISL